MTMSLPHPVDSKESLGYLNGIIIHGHKYGFLSVLKNPPPLGIERRTSVLAANCLNYFNIETDLSITYNQHGIFCYIKK